MEVVVVVVVDGSEREEEGFGLVLVLGAVAGGC